MELYTRHIDESGAGLALAFLTLGGIALIITVARKRCFWSSGGFVLGATFALALSLPIQWVAACTVGFHLAGLLAGVRFGAEEHRKSHLSQASVAFALTGFFVLAGARDRNPPEFVVLTNESVAHVRGPVFVEIPKDEA